LTVGLLPRASVLKRPNFMNDARSVTLEDKRLMNFNTYFRLASYATIAAAGLALFVAGGTGIWLAAAFAIAMVVAWKLEDSRWQFSERAALIIILASLPLFYLDWRLLPVILDIQFLDSGAPTRGSVEVTLLA